MTKIKDSDSRKEKHNNMIKIDTDKYKIYTVPIEDINTIKNIYKNKSDIKDVETNEFNIK